MNLKSSGKFNINIESINCSVSKYPLLNAKVLEITTQDIIDAIVSCGILPKDLNCTTRYKRLNEISFKQHLISMALKEHTDKSGKTLLQLDDDKLMYLDATEKAVVSYYLGMIFTKIISSKVFGIHYLVHTKRFRENYNVSFGSLLEPDLIGYDANMSVYSLFEAKGRNGRDSRALDHAKDQLNAVNSINGKAPVLKVATMVFPTLTGRNIKAVIEDPDEKGEESIAFNEDDYLCSYYENLVNLTEEIRELSETNRDYKYWEDDEHIQTSAVIGGIGYGLDIPVGMRDWVVEYKSFRELGTVTERIFIEKIEHRV